MARKDTIEKIKNTVSTIERKHDLADRIIKILFDAGYDAEKALMVLRLVKKNIE